MTVSKYYSIESHSKEKGKKKKEKKPSHLVFDRSSLDRASTYPNLEYSISKGLIILHHSYQYTRSVHTRGSVSYMCSTVRNKDNDINEATADQYNVCMQEPRLLGHILWHVPGEG